MYTIDEIYSDIIQNMKLLSVKGYIDFGLRLRFYDDGNVIIKNLYHKDNILGWLEEKERYEDAAWLIKELDKLKESEYYGKKEDSLDQEATA